MMKRAILDLGSASSALAVAVVALGYGEAIQAQQTSPLDTESIESTEVVLSRSSNSDQNLTVAEAVLGPGFADENTTREIVREQATEYVQKFYSLLFDDLGLASQQRDSLFALLTEDQIASTWTDYKHGETVDKEEQSRRIAAIIGDPMLKQFRALERNLGVYGEVQSIGSLFQQNGVPLTETQRDGLFRILLETRDQYAVTPPSGAEPGSIEYLQHLITQKDEYERHVMELAPSVLLPEQVVHLNERYQYLSFRRAHALEMQRKGRDDGTMTADSPLWYPAGGD